MMMKTIEVDEPNAALDDGRNVLVRLFEVFFQGSAKELWLSSVLARRPTNSSSEEKTKNIATTHLHIFGAIF